MEELKMFSKGLPEEVRNFFNHRYGNCEIFLSNTPVVYSFLGEREKKICLNSFRYNNLKFNFEYFEGKIYLYDFYTEVIELCGLE